MATSSAPSISAAERLNDGIVIKFANGQCGFYTSEFLFSKLPECEQFDESKIEW